MLGGNEEDIGSYRGQPIWGAGRHSGPKRGGDQGPELWVQPCDSTAPLGGPRAGWLTSPVINSRIKGGWLVEPT